MTKPVFRHLREQSWRLGGSLDRLEERLQCMHVLPDVVPSVQPTVDLEVLFGTGNGIGDHGGEGGSILPGVFLDPARTLEPPSIRATVFHPDERKYTLMLVDPDVPCEETQSFQTYVHWLVKDVPLSLEKNAIPEGHAALLPYIPPHPQRGTPYHRYTMLLFEQTAESTVAEIPREAMDVSAFASAHQLKLAGIHFWREQWTDKTKHTISTIYKDVLKASEPRYGHPGRMDRLKDELGMRQSKYY
ncbi:mitochondrial 54S ribosomal protein YmL35 [Malassezia pachydermatis]